eukprot:gb/GECH01007644.1/.p1 GENE.gb/GECH01007644.1/~~gb/GECH01007644.1/.p1  ORF type:complete len:153 (+),score=5.29 gb/GECH01007644.1/:1-459(+)
MGLGFLITYASVFMLAAGHAVLCAFYILSYSDYEDDLLSSVELKKRLNPLIIIEMAVQAVTTLLWLFTMSWGSLILNLPLTIYHIKVIYDGQHQLDATDLYRFIKPKKQESTIKLGVYIVIFFVYFYCMLMEIIKYALDDEDISLYKEIFGK